MCGVCGFVGLDEPGLIERMTTTLSHRGPDASGIWAEGDAALGHRRLSIIDLAGGRQPMTSPDGRHILTFNGEIYNHRELREFLASAGHSFETNSDTEVLLRMWIHFGPAALKRLNGMFAFAVYDVERRELFLARDRVGIKPLCYVELDGALLFASEPKALLCHGGWDRTVSHEAIRGYLAYRYVPGRTGLFESVRRLPPAHYLRWSAGRSELGTYWSLPEHESSVSQRRSEGDYLDELEECFERSVQRRLMSDVGFGAYLSGGVDSSLIVALASKLSSEPLRTFSVGFDYAHDELAQASATAAELGCRHREIETRGEDIGLLPEIVWYADDPLGDAINIPMFKLAKEVKNDVSVVLTGEGGDELFAGYLFHRVLWAARRYQQLVPAAVQRWIVHPVLSAIPAGLLNVAFDYPADLGRRGKRKVVDFHAMLDREDIDQWYTHLISLFDERDRLGLFTPEFAPLPEYRYVETTLRRRSADEEFHRMLTAQFAHWLPDNMLLRNDRMSMASGLEARVPFLDHELIEFAFRLPRKLRLEGGEGKVLLRRMAERILGKQVAGRRKMPFYVPLERYCSTPAFTDMMDDLLSERVVHDRGIFRPQPIRELRESAYRGEFILIKQIFSLMTLELWFRTFVDRTVAGPTGLPLAHGAVQ